MSVAYLLVVLVSEALVRDGRLIITPLMNDKHLGPLRWAAAAIQATRDENSGDNHNEVESKRDPEEKIWGLAGACYALLLTSLDSCTARNTHISSFGGETIALTNEESTARYELHELHLWWEENFTEWVDSPALPNTELSTEFLEKLSWLTTSAGQKILQQLYKDGRITSQIQEQARMSQG